MSTPTNTTIAVPILTPDGYDFNHLLSLKERDAIYGAIAANRPLLVRGEPGLGKSQLALAASTLLNRPYKSFTIDAHTEARDLLFSFDAVGRLAEAQVAANIYKADSKQLRKAIRIQRFVAPGPLWWAISWDSANRQQKRYQRYRFDEKPVFANPTPPGSWQAKEGIVILIDEIDKADSSLPNGLLEALGSRQFTPQGFQKPILKDDDTKPPLIVITTNRERAMPPAFLRRCLILDLVLPEYEERSLDPTNLLEGSGSINPFIEYFVQLGDAHFKGRIPETVYRKVARLLHDDREKAVLSQTGTKPGPAEFIDLLRAMHDWVELADPSVDSSTPTAVSKESKYDYLLDRLTEFFFTNKHREF